MKLGEYQEIFSENVAKLLRWALEHDYKPRIRECQRTPEQQDIYVKSGKSWTKNSAHLESLAIDIYFTKDGKLLQTKEQLQELGDYWESLSLLNEWGGNWKKNMDCPHFQLTKGKQPRV